MAHTLYTHVNTADTWPEVLEDSNARRDWGWKHHYDLERVVVEMIRRIKEINQLT